MDRDLTAAELNALESMIDSAGLAGFLEGLSSICGEKAVHVATTWQDATLGKHWATMEGAIGVLSTKARGL